MVERPLEGAAVRTRVVAHGRVQGVFFRDSVRRRAQGVGVSGWVRNRADGSVEAVIEGSPEKVEEVVRFFGTGPRGAEVDRLERHDEPVEGLGGFEIR
jgi:acylphosphatase